MSREPLNVVVLGGSFAGLSAAHHFLDHVIQQLRTFESAPRYRVVLVSPSTHLYWNICAPRALVSAGLIPVESAFVPIEPGFSRHPFNEFTYMQGAATAIDTGARTVTVVLASEAATQHSSAGSSDISRSASVQTRVRTQATDYRSSTASRDSTLRTLPYHALILATGSSAYSPLYSLHGAHEKTIAELRSFHTRLETARSILIVGGGPSSVETAGQLATYFNRRSWWPFNHKPAQGKPSSESKKSGVRHSLLCLKRKSQASDTTALLTVETTPSTPAPRTHKTITILSGSERLLPKHPPSIGHKASKKLKNLGVHVVHSIRQVGSSENPDGSINCHLNNDMTITADVLIAATGVYPNTNYLPAVMLDEAGYVVADPEDLRVYGPGVGDRVYAVGDCASYSKNCILDVYDAVPVLMHNLRNDLLAHEYGLQLQLQAPAPLPPPTPAQPLSPAPSRGEGVSLSRVALGHRIAELHDMRFVQNQTDTQLMPITRWGGVGVVFDIAIPSLFVHWWKGRDYRVGRAQRVVKLGKNPYY